LPEERDDKRVDVDGRARGTERGDTERGRIRHR